MIYINYLPELLCLVQPRHELLVLLLQLVVGEHLEDLVLRLGRHVVHHDVGAAHVLDERVLVKETLRVADGHAARLSTKSRHEYVLQEKLIGNLEYGVLSIYSVSHLVVQLGLVDRSLLFYGLDKFP